LVCKCLIVYSRGFEILSSPLYIKSVALNFVVTLSGMLPLNMLTQVCWTRRVMSTVLVCCYWKQLLGGILSIMVGQLMRWAYIFYYLKCKNPY
jgi:hypothetical protein